MRCRMSLNLSPDLERTRSLASAAMAKMLAYEVPPTPRNYAIWYAHSSAASAELSRALDAVFANGGLWTDAAGDAIYHTFIEPSNDQAALTEALGAEIRSVLASITQAGQHTRSYGEALSVVTGEMEREPDGKVIKAIVRELASATRVMTARANELEAELERASSEVDTLRQKNEAIRREALTDGLTSLGNRKHFDDRLAEAARQVAETGDSTCVILGDVDHFKQFNDTWGHSTGDQVLKLVAGCFSDNVKGRDTAARYGGEEFAVILPETTLDNAVKLAEQIRRSVHSKKIVKLSTGETLGSISISMGVARLNGDELPVQVMERVDRCLYAAKRSGRNRVCSEDQIELQSLEQTSAA